MTQDSSSIYKRFFMVSLIMSVVLLLSAVIGLSIGSSGRGPWSLWNAITGSGESDTALNTIIWQLRFPRVILAALTGAALSLGGLVFQALLRNPLAEPYILGISGGSAIGAIIGILLGFSRFPGVSITAFTGSIATLVLLIVMSSGRSMLKNDSLLLSGVMVNAFCSAVIMFLISMTQDTRLHSIIFWLMGDFSTLDVKQASMLAVVLIPCFIVIFGLSNAMNILLLGKDMARSMGVNVKGVTLTLLVLTSFMVSATVSHCGLLGFVGLVIPHLLRLISGSDHRILVPACVLGGGAYMVICDSLARWIPEQGEIPVGVITAMIGAPLFIYLLKRNVR